MEFCVLKSTGQILAARADGAVWGSGESYSRWLEQGNEAGRWSERRLILLKCPDVGELDGYRYEGGLVSTQWLEENEDPEPELSEFEFTAIAQIEVETEPSIP